MELYKFVAPEIIFGPGALAQTGVSLARLGVKKVFIVSDPGVIEAGWVERAIPYIREAGLESRIWYEITSNPKDHEIHRGLQQYKESGCNAVLAIGGGSSVDAAKAVALQSANDGNIREYEGPDKIQNPLPPIVAIPTTAGSGSEVTQFAIVTNTDRKMKMAICSRSLVPDICLIDPWTLTTKSPELTANTGLDALSHAIEAYVSVAATPLTDVQALNAMKLVWQNLPKSMAKRSDLEAKTAMAMASLQAGLALSNAILGLVHAMSHQLGGFLDMAHGEANAILLPYVMEFNLPAAEERFGIIAAAMGQDIVHLSRRDAAQKAIDAVRQLARNVGIPAKLSEIGFTDEFIDTLSENAMQDVCLLTNPKDVQLRDIKNLFSSAL